MSAPSELAARILSGQTPLAVRLAAARGALPLTPEELVLVQVHLRGDDDDKVRTAAEASLERLPRRVVEALRDDQDTPAPLVAYLLEERTDLAGPLRASLVSHPAVELPMLERLARADAQHEVVDALLNDHRRLLEAPALLDHLRANPSLTPDQKRRLSDLSEHLLKTRAPEAAPREAEPEEPTVEPAETPLFAEGLEPAKDPRLAAAGVDAEVEAMLPLLDIDVGDLVSVSEIQGAEDFEGDTEHESAYRRIMQLTVGQKLRIALFGTREERNILVRDTNKLISTSVVKNPRITDHELEQVSISRNVCEEVLLALSKRRDAMKRYSVIHNLARNPKTPTQVAIPLVARLNERDLKLLTKDRNITEVVRVTARKQVAAREARQKSVGFKRKGH